MGELKMRRLGCLAAIGCLLGAADLSVADGPFYKASSFAEVAEDISLNSYGASSLAPDSLGIGKIAPDFTVAQAGGGLYRLSEASTVGPVVIIFYRGHW